MTSRLLSVEAREVVYVKSIFEANLGVGAIFADHGGVLTVAAPHSQGVALDELLDDLQQELGALMSVLPASPAGDEVLL
jgi:hypothetical protein